MYQEGTEVIFACGGSVGKSVMAAAKEAGKKVIGVDVDQRYDSDTVITSATKGLGASVIQVLEAIYKTNSWANYAGKTTYFNASNKGVGLPTEVLDGKGTAFDRFKSFNQAAYDTIFAKLADGSVKPIRELKVADTSGVATKDELVNGLSLVKVKVEVR
jgi:basic membrane protein A